MAPAAQPPAQEGVLPLPAGGSLPAALQQVQPRLIFTLFNLEEVQMKVFVEKQLEKLEAAKAACLVRLSLLSLTGPY